MLADGVHTRAGSARGSGQRWGRRARRGVVAAIPLLLLSILRPAPGCAEGPSAPGQNLSREEKCSTLEKEYRRVAEQLADAFAQLADVVTQLEASRSLKAEVARVQQENKALLSRVVVAQEKAESLEALGKKREQEYSDCRVDVAEIGALHARDVADLQICADEMASLQRDSDGSSAEARGLKEKIGELEARLSEAQALEKDLQSARERAAALSPLEKEIKDQRGALGARDKEIAKLTKDLEAARQKVAALEPLKKEAGEKRDALEDRDKQIAKLTKDLEAARQKVAVLEPLKKEVDEKREALESRDKQVAKLTKDLEAARQKVATLEQLKKEVDEKREALESRDKQVAKLTKDLEAARQKVATLEQLKIEVDEKQEALESQDKQIAQLTKEFDDAQQISTKSRQEGERLSETRIKLAKKVKESVSKVMALQSQVFALENELRSLKER